MIASPEANMREWFYKHDFKYHTSKNNYDGVILAKFRIPVKQDMG
jgi:hypothetical protein